MYHLNKNIQIMDGLIPINLSFHYLSRYEVDFVNGITTAQVSSCINREDWINNNFFSRYVNSFQVNDIPSFNEDPSSFIFKKLISIEGTIFYDSEIVRDYMLEKYDRELFPIVFIIYIFTSRKKISR